MYTNGYIKVVPKVVHLSADCRRMLERAGSMLHVEIMPDDPEYSVAKFRMGTD